MHGSIVAKQEVTANEGTAALCTFEWAFFGVCIGRIVSNLKICTTPPSPGGKVNICPTQNKAKLFSTYATVHAGCGVHFG